jgi:hypothetical protein
MRSWKPTTAGILEIIAGALQLAIGAVTILVAGGVAGGMHIANMPRMSWLVPLPLIAGIGLPPHPGRKESVRPWSIRGNP